MFSISRGSLLEAESIPYVAIRAKRLEESQCAEAFEQIDAVSRMLTNLLKALDRRLRAGNLPPPASRLSLPASRFPSPASRVPLPESRFPLPASRFPLLVS